MRICRALTGTAIGVVLAMGAITVPAHAAQPQTATQSANVLTSATSPAKESAYAFAGAYLTFAACEVARAGRPGSANHPSYCSPYGAMYYLFIWV